jgi:hypothetical protein
MSPRSVTIDRFDWSAVSRLPYRGVRVQCPRCGLGVQVYVKVSAGLCSRCGCVLVVLTSDRVQPARRSCGRNSSQSGPPVSATAPAGQRDQSRGKEPLIAV